jgi:hypothetical protein
MDNKTNSQKHQLEEEPSQNNNVKIQQAKSSCSK